MGLPTVCTVLTCPECNSDECRVSCTGRSTTVYVKCRRGHRFLHPNQAFARDLVRGRERIVVGRRG